MIWCTELGPEQVPVEVCLKTLKRMVPWRWVTTVTESSTLSDPYAQANQDQPGLKVILLVETFGLRILAPTSF